MASSTNFDINATSVYDGMKIDTNTVVPKIMKMRSEIEICQKILLKGKEIMCIVEPMEFAKQISEFLENFPELNYLKEEADSIKEAISEVYDGYETREECVKYMGFMYKMMQNSLEYMG